MSNTNEDDETSDLLNRGQFIAQLLEFVENEHDFVQGGLVVTLEGKFGSGKSTVLDLWKQDLADKGRSPTVVAPIPVVLNAWENDYCDNPFFAILSALTKQSGAKGSSLRKGLKEVAWFGYYTANAIAAKVIDPVEIGEQTKAKTQKLAQLLSDYEGQVEALSKVKKVLKDQFGGESPNAIIMVDELDRCRPDYAVKYLEVIKHIFDVSGLVFVLAIDSDQLKHSVTALFGDLNFDEYFRKFAHRRIPLPAPTEHGLKKLGEAYYRRYISKEGKRFTGLVSPKDRIEIINGLVFALSLTPRQAEEAFRIVGHLFSVKEDGQTHRLWVKQLGAILLATLKVSNAELFHNLGNQSIDLEETYRFLKDKGISHPEIGLWLGVVASGTGVSEVDWRKFAESKSDIEHKSRDYADYLCDWSLNDSRLGMNEVYKEINFVSKFSVRMEF